VCFKEPDKQFNVLFLTLPAGTEILQLRMLYQSNVGFPNCLQRYLNADLMLPLRTLSDTNLNSEIKKAASPVVKKFLTEPRWESSTTVLITIMQVAGQNRPAGSSVQVLLTSFPKSHHLEDCCSHHLLMPALLSMKLVYSAASKRAFVCTIE